MAILIVDDEVETREGLRNLLAHLGHKVILEARNGYEALKLAELEKSRIKMIIATYEMLNMDGIALLQKMSELPFLNLTPYILTTSDLSQSQIKDYLRKYQRLDSCLVKPFRVNSLEKSMKASYLHRCTTRNRILYLGKTSPDYLIQALQNYSLPLSSQIIQAHSREDLLERVKDQSSDIFTWFFEVESFSEAEKIQLKEIFVSFKKSPLGIHTPVVCMSLNPSEIFHFRTLCQFYWTPTNLVEDWLSIVKKVQFRLFHSWNIEILFQKTKPLVQEKKWTEAWKSTQQLLKISTEYCEVQTLAGDLKASLNQPKSAIQHYKHAIQLNPTLPRPYLRAFNLFLRHQSLFTSSPEDVSIFRWMTDLAIQYCPHNVDILFSISKVCHQIGHSDRAKPVLEDLLKKNPTHLGALNLLNEMNECPYAV